MMRGFAYSVMESSEDGNRNHSGLENLKILGQKTREIEWESIFLN